MPVLDPPASPVVADHVQFDKDEVGRLALRHNLPAGGDTEQKFESGGEELLGHQDGERTPHDDRLRQCP